MILERFDAVVFIGDDSLKQIYAAFNMLLRENIAMGSLKQWELNEGQRDACRCDNQLSKSECSSHMVMESQGVREKDDADSHRSPFSCDRRSTTNIGLQEASIDTHRHPACIPSHHRLPSGRGAACQIHLAHQRRPRRLQAYPTHTLSLISNITFLVQSNRLDGRVGDSGRCFWPKHPHPVGRPERAGPSQASRPDPDPRQQCSVALHSGDDEGSEG